MTIESRRRMVSLAIALVLGSIVASVYTFVRSFEPVAADAVEPPAPALPPIAPARTTGPLVALSFDDGPTPERTPYVLDVLREKGVRATFFLQGDRAAADQAVILLHDASDVVGCPAEQWDYLPRAIDTVRSKGFEFGVVALAEKKSRLNQGSSIVVVP